MDRDKKGMVIEHIVASWIGDELAGKPQSLWEKDLEACDYECSIAAVDHLRRTQQFPPTPAVFLETWRSIHKGAHPQLPPPAPRESVYLREAKKLVEHKSAAAFLLMTPTSQLDVEAAGLKAKLLDCSSRHRAHLDTDKPPTQAMMAELAALNVGVESWGEAHKDLLAGDRLSRKRQEEARQKQKQRTGPS